VEQVIGPLLAFAGSLIPIMGLVWKLSAVVSQVKQNTGDLNFLGEKLRKLDVETDRKFEEIAARLNAIDIKLENIGVTLEFLRGK
jgi:hypothetical protein